MVFRVLHYMMRVWEHVLREHEDVRELPFIIPLVLYHSENRWQSGDWRRLLLLACVE